MALPERNHSPERLPVGRDERAAEQLKTARAKGTKREIVLNEEVIFSFFKIGAHAKLATSLPIITGKDIIAKNFKK